MIIVAIYTIYYKNNKIQQTPQAHKTKIKKKMSQKVSKNHKHPRIYTQSQRKIIPKNYVIRKKKNSAMTGGDIT